MSKVVISTRGGSKDFFARWGVIKKLKQQGVRGSNAKKFIAVLALFGPLWPPSSGPWPSLALFGQELVPAEAGEIFFSGQIFLCLF